MCIRQFKATTIFKHFNVVVMMRMTYASYMQFLWKCWHVIRYGAFCHRGGKKGCHGDESENDVTTPYRFRKLTEIPVQKEVGVSVSCKIDGVLPETGFPHDGGKETRNAMDTVQTKGASHTTQAIVLRRSSQRLYLWSVCFRGGSSS